MMAGVVCLASLAGAMPTSAGVATEQATERAVKLPAPVARQWECRAVGPFGIRSIAWQPEMISCSNAVLKLLNNSTVRIHAVYTNVVLAGDFTLKTRFKRGSFVGLVKADKTKGLLGLQVMGGSPHTLEIKRVGSEVSMLLDGLPFHYRNYGVKKTDTFLFGVILNKNKTCELYGLACETASQPAKNPARAAAEKRSEKKDSSTE
jgi:hypothetical protein